MKRRAISLDGDWERRDFLDEAWRWSDALRRAADDASAAGPPAGGGISAGWRTGRVPGSTIDDAWRAGEIPNPYLDRNSLAAEWVPQRTWLYRRRVTIPPDAAPNAALRFEGIDPGGLVFLDGEEVARHTGMFAPLEIGLGDRLPPGSVHDLVVVLGSAPPMPSQVARTDEARLLRSRMSYGWDFCPRMIHTGVWRSVTLETFDARLRGPRLAIEVAADRRSASVTVIAAVEGGATDARVTGAILGPDGAIVAETSEWVVDGEVRIGLDVENPRLWWPNGTGDPALHRLRLRLHSSRGDPLDEREIAFGVRTVELVATEGARPDALPYTLVLNGRPTWIRGWNWTPLDACLGVPRPEKLGHLVELLRRANVNLLRVWGGGVLESDALYEACDRAGIMIWQEFAQSSSGVASTPADDPEVVGHAREQAERLVPIRAHHPSLVIWCGGNELAAPDGRPLTDAHPVLAVLRDAVERLDADAAWLPTSPSGPRFDNSLTALAEDPDGLHDVHGPWEHQGLTEQHTLANATTSLLHSEFGVEGMTNPATLRATVTDRDRWTADRTDPVLAHRGAWWNNRPFVERAFGAPLSLEELARASQHLQRDGLRTLIEGDRRRWPRNAGSLPWVFNEPFPNAWSNAAVDYFGTPKAAYHAVAEAYAPVLPGVSVASQALDGGTELAVRPWLVNDTDAPLSGPMSVALHDVAGRCLTETAVGIDAGPNAVGTVPSVRLDIPDDAADLLVLDVRFGDHHARRLLSRTATLEPMRRLARAELGASVTADGDAWTVRLSVTGAVAAVEARLDDARSVGWPERTGAAYLDGNVLTLLPGERRAIGVEWHDVPGAERALLLTGWNVEGRELRHG